jgi:hypothetical protein
MVLVVNLAEMRAPLPRRPKGFTNIMESILPPSPRNPT